MKRAIFEFFFASRRRHTRSYGDWSSDVCSSDLAHDVIAASWAWAPGTGGVTITGPVVRIDASTRRPGPARRNHVVRTRRRQARPHRSARPGAAELPGLEVRVEAVGLEALERPIVRPAGGWRSGEPRTDDVAQVLEILHHLGAVERLV